ncbi:MAG: Uncharacterized protein G01um101416_963 [Microgenomates group bacterium Gr01-1014_16]|nr:MAG: Uncharacterized protein G01um101416_963 [Microgenomates group bacterium Gr01-1014_16]
MRKIEYIWKSLLNQALEKREFSFRQQDLAKQLGLSSSTVNLAMSPLRQMGAVRIGKRVSEIVDPEKILYHWANHHRLQPVNSVRVNLPILQIEGLLPDGSIPTAYTAVRERFGEPPADYDKVYVYHPHPQAIIDRFTAEITSGPPNLFILLPDPLLKSLSLSHLFVDLWNLPDWYAKDFVNFVKSKFNELLP